jgi:hypothetical protein
VHHTLKPSRNFAMKNPDTGERVRIAVNSLGLRGPEPTIPKPAATWRILCLGDDATFAQYVTENETFCNRLQAALAEQLPGSTFEVLNAGVPDYCPLLSFLQYRHELLALAPDLIVLNFDMSDVSDDYQVRRYAVMNSEGVPLSCSHPALETPRTVVKGGRDGVLLLPQVARQQLNALLAERTLGEKSRSIDSPRCRYLWLDDQPPDWSVHISQALGPLEPLAGLAQAGGARLIVAACPAPWQVSAAASNGPGTGAALSAECGCLCCRRARPLRPRDRRLRARSACRRRFAGAGLYAARAHSTPSAKVVKSRCRTDNSSTAEIDSHPRCS